MFSTDFTLTQGDVLEVQGQSDRIRLLFPQVSIKFEHTEGISRAKNLWVTIDGCTEEICYKCKQYITALTNPESKVNIKIPEDVQKQLLLGNGKTIREIELQNSVVLDLNVLTHNVSIQGEELQVVLAKSIIDDLLDKAKQTLTKANEIEEVSRNMSKISIGNNVKNFGLKLGFTEDDISLAANKCIENGVKVNEDAILTELMKQQPQKAITYENNANEIFQEDFVAKTVAEHTSENLTADNCDLRGIVIDGSNVAMCHGHKQVFSCIGIEIVVNWFKKRGHKNIVVFVPQWRQESPKGDCPIINQEILTKLEKEKILVFTPSRRVNGRRVVCYDDRYIVKYAVEADSVIVSNDNFRDLQKENFKWKQYIDQHMLMYSFVNDMFMPPDDPLGRSGPNLEEFLRTGPYKTKICPYKNKCTYGMKCRYFHPDTSADASNNSNSTYTNSKQNNCNGYLDNLSYKNPIPYMSCAAEINMLERQSTPSYHLYDNDIVAKCPSVAIPPTNQYQDNWHQNSQQSKIYQQVPKYYHNQQQPAQPLTQHRQMQAPPPQQQQHYYNYQHQPHPSQSQHPSQQQQWGNSPQQQQQQHYNSNGNYHQSFTLQQQQNKRQHQPQLPPNNGNSNQYQYMSQMHHSNRGNQQNSYSQQHPNSHPTMMSNQYIHDNRQVNGHVYHESAPITHTIRPIETRDPRSTSERPSPLRTDMEGSPIYQHLLELFPNPHVVRKVLLDNPNERDMNRLVTHALNEPSH